MSLEAWNAFRAGENPEPDPFTLPCVGCDRPTSEADSVPGYYGDCSCPPFRNSEGVSYPGIDCGTLCLSCKKAEDETRAWWKSQES